MGKTIIAVVGIGIVIAGLAGGFFEHLLRAGSGEQADISGAAIAREHVKAVKPKRQTIKRALTVPGEVLPSNEITLFARVGGYLETLNNLDIGSEVKQGDELAKVSVPELERRLAVQRADLAMIAPAIARDNTRIASAKTLYERARDLRDKTPNLISQERVDELKAEYDIAVADLAVTSARNAMLEAEIAETQTQIDLATLRAPFAGVVTERHVYPGELVVAGVTKLLHIVNIESLKVRAHVPEVEIDSLPAGALAHVTFTDLPGREWTSSAMRNATALNQGTKTLLVEFDLPNERNAAGQPVIRPGMYAKVRIELEEHPNVLTVPAGALMSKKRSYYVYTLKNDVVQKASVKIGADDGKVVEIISGLKDDDLVITDGKSLVNAGETVIVTKEETP